MNRTHAWLALLPCLTLASCGEGTVLFLTVRNPAGDGVQGVTVTLYGSFEDWAAERNPLVSGRPDAEGSFRTSNGDVGALSEVWVDVVDDFNPNVTNWDNGMEFDGSNIRHLVDPEVSTGITLYENYFYDELLASTFEISSQTTNGADSWDTLEDCEKDDTIAFDRSFDVTWSEGADVCAGALETMTGELTVDRTYREGIRLLVRDPETLEVLPLDYSTVAGTLTLTELVGADTVVTTYTAL